MLKKIAIPLIHEFFRRRGELLDLPWDELYDGRQVALIYEGWQNLPEARRRQVQTILQDLLELTDDRGMKVFAEEVRAKAPDRVWEFASCRSRLNKAMWFFLNFPESFERAALFARADALSSGRHAVRRNSLPRIPLDVTPEVTRSLEAALRDYYWPNEMRGNHCHVEHYTRSGGNEYFFAYLDDWPDTRLVFDDNGELSPRSELYAFSVLFVFCPHDGSLELIAKGGPEIQYALQQAFCKSLFDMDIEPSHPLRPEYRLQHVLNPEFTYATEMRDGIARVRLTRIHLGTNSNTFPVIGFDLHFRPSVTRTQWLEIIHRDIEAHGLKLDDVVVQQATFQLLFMKCGFARAKTMTFTVTAPSLCNLRMKPDEDREIGERCLKMWGMVDG
ncbi:MAG: hypothetical protein AB7F89_17645 [Pirellulaceae bacterium]